MKTLILIICLALVIPLTPGCPTVPSERVIANRTLQVLGTTAKAAMDSATAALKSGRITVEQWRKVATFYDDRWQPAYTFAAAAAKSDLSGLASPDLDALATEFANLVAQQFKPTP